jgi:putative peptidoglycan lipid II flippase
VQAVTAYRMLRRKVGSLRVFALTQASWKFLVAAALSSAVGLLLLGAIGGTGEGAFAVRSVATASVSTLAVAAAMSAIYILVLRMLRSSETDALFDMVRGILRR